MQTNHWLDLLTPIAQLYKPSGECETEGCRGTKHQVFDKGKLRTIRLCHDCRKQQMRKANNERKRRKLQAM